MRYLIITPPSAGGGACVASTAGAQPPTLRRRAWQTSCASTGCHTPYPNPNPGPNPNPYPKTDPNSDPNPNQVPRVGVWPRGVDRQLFRPEVAGAEAESALTLRPTLALASALAFAFPS